MTRISRTSAFAPKVDTRGLPFGFDPRNFYEYASLRRQQSADGLEGLLYTLIPREYIRSLAFAIDPLSQLKVSATRISPVVRTRRKSGVNVLQARSYTYFQSNSIAAYKYLPGGYVDNHGPSTTLRSAQPSIEDVSEDIVASDRPAGSDMGEFSKWKVQLFSPSRSNQYHDNQTRWYDDYPSGYLYKFRSGTHYTGNGPAAYITKSTVDALRGEVQGKQLQVMQKNVLGMYKGTNSQKRATTLFRSIAELKDLPRGILQLQKTLQDLRNLSDVLEIPKTILAKIHASKKVVKDIPQEFLSYSFGWSQIYRDCSDLLLAPERISKRINFLLRRNGKATTYRSQRSSSEAYMTTSGFTYDQFPSETVLGNDSNITIEHKLRMVISATFQFPEVDSPRLRNKEFYRQLGVVPTPMDLYNLVPWTWLFDWFTGFGNYLDIIEAINTDKNLINWGLLTCESDGALSTTYACKIQSSDSMGTQPTVFSYPVTGHTSVLKFSSQLRRDVSGLLDVNAIAERDTLTPFQSAILGSLLFGRVKF